MAYSIILIGIAITLISAIQLLRFVLPYHSYKKKALSLTLGVASFFFPISVCLMLLAIYGSRIDTNLLIAFSGVGSFSAIFFFAKAFLET